MPFRPELWLLELIPKNKHLQSLQSMDEGGKTAMVDEMAIDMARDSVADIHMDLCIKDALAVCRNEVVVVFQR
jgi:hypothetical protein